MFLLRNFEYFQKKVPEAQVLHTTRKFYMRRNNKVDTIKTERIVTAHSFPEMIEKSASLRFFN